MIKKNYIPDFCDISTLPSDSKSIVLGMSGGVDSASTAAILKQCGHRVVGVFLELFSSNSVEKSKNDAMIIANNLGIEFHVVDYKKEFHKSVIEPFVDSYCNYKTPIPCALCNRFIKFTALTEFADKSSIEYVSTGHYAKKILFNGVFALQSAKDLRQDQTYFLHKIKQEHLNRAIFPLANASKKIVREYANNIGLHVHEKKTQIDVCFLSDYQGKYSPFIKDYLNFNNRDEKATKRGNIFNCNNEIVGHHNGAINYTIGQRKGLGISSFEPLYVFNIDNNDIYVAPKNKLAVNQISLYDISFHDVSKFFLQKDKENKVFVQIRSTTREIPAYFKFNENDNLITFEHAQYGVSPGQAAVIRSDNGIVLAGGFIKKYANQSSFS